MGKMVNVLILFLLIELAMTLFVGCIGTACEENTSLFDILLSPEDWNASALWSLVSTNIFLIGGATAITVGTLWMKSEFLVYAGVTSTLFGFGQNIYRLWQGISTIAFLDGGIGKIISSIFILGILVYVLVTMLDFARGRD